MLYIFFLDRPSINFFCRKVSHHFQKFFLEKSFPLFPEIFPGEKFPTFSRNFSWRKVSRFFQKFFLEKSFPLFRKFPRNFPGVYPGVFPGISPGKFGGMFVFPVCKRVYVVGGSSSLGEKFPEIPGKIFPKFRKKFPTFFFWKKSFPQKTFRKVDKTG